MSNRGWGWDWDWNPFRSREMVAALWSSAPTATNLTAGYGAFLFTIRRLLLGRNLTINVGRSAIALKVTEFGARSDRRAMAVGQFGDIRAVAQDVTYDQYRFPRVDAVLRNVHLRPGTSAQLVIAPVELQLQVPDSVVAALLAITAPRVEATIGEDAIVRMWWRRHPRIGHLEVVPDIVGTTLTLRPKTLVMRSRRWRLPDWVPRHSVPLPAFHGMLATNLALGPQCLTVSAMLPEWKFDLPKARWDDIVAQLNSSTGLLRLGQFHRRR